MEFVLAKTMSHIGNAGPYATKYEVLPNQPVNDNWAPGLMNALFLWDPRVADLLANKPQDLDFENRVTRNLSHVWLPTNFPRLSTRAQRAVLAKGSANSDDPLVNTMFQHNVRVIAGTPDDPPQAFMITDPRVEPNDAYTRDDVLELAQDFYIPKLFAWLGNVTCDEAFSLKGSPNVLAFIQLAIANGPTPACKAFLEAVSQDLLIFAAVPEEMWSDHPSDPCDVKHAFPWFVTHQCLAICDYRANRQCPRMAMKDSTFCAWHGRAQVTMHIRPMKRSASDIRPDQYSNRSLNLETYSGTKRFVSGMTFASQPHTRPKVGFYLPVLRYEGLYHAYDPRYCGKFYFYEPESHLHLYLGNSRCFGSKVHAFVALSMERWPKGPPRHEVWGDVKVHEMRSMGFNTFLTHDLEPLFDIIIRSPHVHEAQITECDTYTKGSNPDNTKFWDDFILSRYWSVYLSESDVPKTVEGLPVMFPTDNPGNWAVTIGEFDTLDQPICDLAQKLNIDTVIFQHEIGSHDCVSEILDTRADYKDHLYDLGKIVEMAPQGPRKYPKIWFPRDDHLVYVGPNAVRAEMTTHVTELFPSLFPPVYFQCFTREGELRRYEDAVLANEPRRGIALLRRLYPDESEQALRDRFSRDVRSAMYTQAIRDNDAQWAQDWLELLEPTWTEQAIKDKVAKDLGKTS